MSVHSTSMNSGSVMLTITYQGLRRTRTHSAGFFTAGGRASGSPPGASAVGLTITAVPRCSHVSNGSTCEQSSVKRYSSSCHTLWMPPFGPAAAASPLAGRRGSSAERGVPPSGAARTSLTRSGRLSGTSHPYCPPRRRSSTSGSRCWSNGKSLVCSTARRSSEHRSCTPTRPLAASYAIQSHVGSTSSTWLTHMSRGLSGNACGPCDAIW
mmetsp:Transcript_1219/g.3197  ORF Transcript_1219/g.3197 Transcript_1219/m.3197 type:complete len:211 (-) Transcript_1219:605-1237(-)